MAMHSLFAQGVRRALLIPAILFASMATAQAVQVNVSGHLTKVDAYLRDTFSVGQAYSLSFDWAGPGPSTPIGMYGSLYPSAGASFALQIGSYLITSDSVGYLLNAPPTGAPFTGDTYRFGAAQQWTSTIAGTTLSGSYLVADRFPYWAGVELGDATGQALASSALYSPIPILPDYATRELVVRFASSVTPDAAFGVQGLTGSVDSVTAVPEPETYAMLLAGLGLLGLAARRRKM
jgi:hypothetical protein